MIVIPALQTTGKVSYFYVVFRWRDDFIMINLSSNK